MNHKTNIVGLFLLPFILLSCSLGTDPGDCETIECLPVDYSLRLVERTRHNRDSTHTNYSADVTIRERSKLVMRNRNRVPYVVTVNETRLVNIIRDNRTHISRFVQELSELPPAGQPNAWQIALNGEILLKEELQTPSSFLIPLSLQPDDTVQSGEDIRLTFNDAPEGLSSFEIIARTEKNGEFWVYTITREAENEVIIPAALLAEHEVHSTNLALSIYQSYISNFLSNGYHIMADYTRQDRYQVYID